MRTLRRHFIWRIRKKCSQAEIFAHEVDCIPNARKQKNTNWDVPLTPHWKSNGSLDFIQIIYLHKVLWVCEDPALGDIKKQQSPKWWQLKMVGMMATNKIYVQMNSSETKPLPKLKKDAWLLLSFKSFFFSFTSWAASDVHKIQTVTRIIKGQY